MRTDRRMLVPRRFLGALAVAALVAAACGGGESGPGPTPPPPPVTAVLVSPSTVALQGVGATATVSAALTPSTATAALTWSAANPAVATVSGSGTSASITAVGAGTTTIAAAAGAVVGTMTVIVTPVVRSVTAPAAVALLVGASTRPTIVITADAGASQALTFSTSAAAVATVATDGTINGVSPGTATVTVASAAFSTVTTSITVSVSYPVVRSVTLTPANATILRGATRAFAAAVDVDAGTSTAVAWTTSNAATATVSASGVVTAIAAGASTIRATSVANPLVSGSALVNVAEPTVRSVTLSPNNPTVPQGGTRQLTAALDADVGANTALTWSSTDASIASISNSGLITALQPGNTTVRATSMLVPAAFGTVTVTVTAAPPLSTWTEGTTEIPTSKISNARETITLDNLTSWGISGAVATGERRMLFYDGTRWTAPAVAPFDGVTAMGSFGNSAWLGGSAGQFAQLRVSAVGNSIWLPMTSPSNLRVTRVVGTSSTQAVALNNAGVLALSGGAWTQLPATGMSNLSAIDASSPGNIVVAAQTGAAGSRLRRWNGSVWTIVPEMPGTSGPVALLMFGDTIIVSTQGQSFRFDGTNWTPLTQPVSTRTAVNEDEGILDFAGCGGEKYASTQNGGRVFRLVGTTWTVIGDYGVAALASRDVRLGCSTSGVLRALGNGGSVGRYTGSAWVQEHLGGGITRVRAVRPDLAYLTFGSAGISRWDGTRWRVEMSDAVGIANSAADLTGLSVAPDGTAMATGGGEPIRVGIYQRGGNGTWTFTATPSRCTGIWTASAAFALVVGRPGCALRYNGSSWLPLSAPNGVWNDVDGTGATFAMSVGISLAASASMRWDGTTWTQLTTPNVGELLELRVLSPTQAWARSRTAVIRWDGTQWTIVSTPTLSPAQSQLSAMSVNSATDVYLITRNYDVYRYDGTTWTQVASVSQAAGDPFGAGAAAIHTIPGFGIIGGGSAQPFHSTSLGALLGGPRR